MLGQLLKALSLLTFRPLPGVRGVCWAKLKGCSDDPRNEDDDSDRGVLATRADPRTERTADDDAEDGVWGTRASGTSTSSSVKKL